MRHINRLHFNCIALFAPQILIRFRMLAAKRKSHLKARTATRLQDGGNSSDSAPDSNDGKQLAKSCPLLSSCVKDIRVLCSFTARPSRSCNQILLLLLLLLRNLLALNCLVIQLLYECVSVWVYICVCTVLSFS